MGDLVIDGVGIRVEDSVWQEVYRSTSASVSTQTCGFARRETVVT